MTPRWVGVGRRSGVKPTSRSDRPAPDLRSAGKRTRCLPSERQLARLVGWLSRSRADRLSRAGGNKWESARSRGSIAGRASLRRQTRCLQVVWRAAGVVDRPADGSADTTPAALARTPMPRPAAYSRRSRLMEWVLGYISGRNREDVLPRERLVGSSFQRTDTVIAWLQNYCRSHSLDFLMAAADNLRADFQRHERR
jgi:hypothetical protein